MDFTGTAAAGLAGLIVSLINCLFGFRLQKFWVGVVCFLFGGTALSLVAGPLRRHGCMWLRFLWAAPCWRPFSFRLYLASLFVFSLGLVWLTAYWLIPTAWLGHVAGLVLGVLAGVLVTELHTPGHHSSYGCNRRVFGREIGVSAGRADHTGQQQCILGHGSRWAGGLCAGGRVPVPQHKGINGPPHVKNKGKKAWAMNEVFKPVYGANGTALKVEITPQEKQAILRAAFEAPTAGNQQLYTILDITDSALKQTLSETCDHQPFIAKAPMVLIFCADCQNGWTPIRPAAVRRAGPAGRPSACHGGRLHCGAEERRDGCAKAWALARAILGIFWKTVNSTAPCWACRNMSFRLPCWCLGARRPASLRAKSRAAVRASFWCMKTVTAACRQASFAPCWAIRRRRGPVEEWLRSFCDFKYNSGFSREMSRSAAEYVRVFLQGEADWNDG